ncbi:restriction endonuclease subunit S [Cronobacter sakazakii]|nr:restriction endonuclease subunit S [Cronobacter sakazakii]ELY4373256.1 restriction endonuclease subunit S [Cronobacter sakazakii]
MRVEKLLTDHIDIWSSALQTRSTAGRGSSGKIDLYGIKKLRELILELAVRGKLVPQDPNDEPASELLKHIAIERDELVKRKVIRKTKLFEKITITNTPFDLPDGWEWCYLNDIGDWGAGATPSRSNSKYYNGDIPWFKSGELSSDFICDSEEKITELALHECSLRENKVGDVLIAMYGATIGKTSILSVRGTTNQAVCACTPYSGISNVYLLTLLKAYKRIFIGMGAGGAQPNISREKLIATIIALPPKAEQKRIICKVDELMSLCDQLEQQSLTSLEAHQQLVGTLLATLTDSQNAEELAENWARISQHFDTLFTTEASIDALKQTILQLAVMGKLVPQDPNDEPASELLKRIEQEKAQLVKEGKIKKQKPLPPVSDEEKNVDLPLGWVQARVDNVFNIIVDCPHSTANFEESGILCIDTNTFKNGRLIHSKFRFVSDSTYEERTSRLKPVAGDIVFAREGSVGESVVIPDNLKCCLGQRVMLLRPSRKMNSELLRYILSSKKTLDELLSLNKGVGVKHVNVKDVKNHIMVLPPENEQKRILSKIDDMYALCDQLKSRLQSAQQTQLHLADALTDAALN